MTSTGGEVNFHWEDSVKFMPLHQQIQTEMQQALKAGEKDMVRTLRSLLAQLKDGAIAKRSDLSDEEEIKIIQKAAKQRKESIEMFQKGNRDDLVETESKELTIIETYLPKQLLDKEVESIIGKTIKELDATTMKDMGRVMSIVMKQIAGRTDGKMVQKLVRQKLRS